MRCGKCGAKKKLTTHHVYSMRHFGGARKSKDVATLCRNCHDEIELLIPYEKQDRWFYPYILEWYVNNDVSWLIRNLRRKRRRKCR